MGYSESMDINISAIKKEAYRHVTFSGLIEMLVLLGENQDSISQKELEELRYATEWLYPEIINIPKPSNEVLPSTKKRRQFFGFGLEVDGKTIVEPE